VCKMGERRQRHSKEFKEQTVKYIQQNHKTLPELAEELNIPVGTLSNWVQVHSKFEDEPFIGSGNLRESDRLIKEKDAYIKDLEEEIAILKKAMHYFSKDRK
ncbi:transposase, partial [Paenibacillus sp. Soil787]|uniref:transposase n=1 Tax=Paenibacillus sp. Soil787 TaxID=1736411 RepID=UPI001F1B581D